MDEFVRICDYISNFKRLEIPHNGEMTKLYLLLIPLVLTLVFQNAIAEQDWNTYWIKGKYYLSDLKPAFQVFKIQYRITGGEVEQIEYNNKAVVITAKITTYNDGLFEIKIPRNLPMTNIGREDSFFIVVDGEEIKYQEEKSECLRIISIPFQNGNKVIEIIGATILNDDPVRSIVVPSWCIIKPSPKDQIENGISRENVICKEGLQLIFKSKDNSPVCVKPQTAEKLIQRGWGMTNKTTQIQMIMVSNSNFTINYNIQEGQLIDAYYSSQSKSLFLSLNATDNNELTIMIPRALIDIVYVDDQDESFIVLTDGTETEYTEHDSTSTYRILTIPVKQGLHEIEIVVTFPL